MPSGSQRTCLCSRNLWAGQRASALPGSDALVSWEGVAVPQEPSGAQSPSASLAMLQAHHCQGQVQSSSTQEITLATLSCSLDQ